MIAFCLNLCIAIWMMERILFVLKTMGVYILCAGQLTWLVFLIGSVIGGRISYTSADDYDSMDGQLVCRYVT